MDEPLNRYVCDLFKGAKPDKPVRRVALIAVTRDGALDEAFALGYQPPDDLVPVVRTVTQSEWEKAANA